MRKILSSFMLIAALASATEARAQIVSANPLEWMALAEGNELINGQIESQIKGETKTAILQNTIAAEFNQMHKWQKEYNGYLKSVNGYASSLKACTHLYDDGVRIFITLCKLRKAISDNPQGIVATMSMNNLYIETATELVSVFNLLNEAVAKGGNENMLTGSERSKTLWMEKPRTFDPRRHVVLTPSGKIRLTPSGKIKMTPGNIAFSGAFLLVLVTVLADGYKK